MSIQSQGILEYPVNMDNEANIISNAIQDEKNRQIFVRMVTYEKFRNKQFQAIAWGITEAVQANLDIDLDIILLKARSSPLQPTIDFDFIQKIVTEFSIVSEKNFKEHIETLIADATKQEAINWIWRSFLPACVNTTTTVADIDSKINYAKSIIEGGYSSTRLDFKTMKEIVEEYDRNKQRGVNRRTTGFEQLDQHLTEGFLEGKITTVAGLSSAGKSSMVLTLMKNLSHLQTPIPAAQFALEMNNTSIFTKLLAFKRGLPVNTVIKKPYELTEEELCAYNHNKDIWAENDYLFLDDKPTRSIASMREQILLLQDKIQQQYIVVVVDLFGKLRDFQNSDNFARDYEKKLNAIQILVRELGIHMILVTQINRQVSKRKNKRPTMNDLKNAHALTEVSDIMFGIHRPYYKEVEVAQDQWESDYDDNSGIVYPQMDDADPNANIAEVIIMKQRMGPKDVIVNFIFDPMTTCFYPITEDYQRRLNELKLEDEL